MTRLTTIAIFFFSGVAALIYQVVWVRELGLVFGITTYAVATVLATFMAGLALGSHVFGGVADTQRRPLRSYALLEVAIGIYALVVPWLLHGLRPIYIGLAHLDPPYVLLALGRASLAVAVLLPPTTLMGGTFPFLVRYFVRHLSEVGRSAAVLYFINTAGALVGCMSAGFFLLEHFGLSGTTRIAAAISIGAGCAALALDVFRPSSIYAPSPVAADVDEGPPAEEPSPAAMRLALFCIGVSGFASLAYEVVWTRALLRYLYNSTYAFTAMLATFLAGLAVGSALHGAFLRGRRRPLFLFAALEAGVGFGFLGAALLFSHLPAITAAALGSSVITSFHDSLMTMFIRAALILFPAAVCLGATLPLATEICARTLSLLGKTVGRVYAVNTVGAIAGSLAGGFLLIPLLGMQGTLYLLVAINILLALLLVSAERAPLSQRVFAGSAITVVALAIAIAIPSDLFRRTFGTNPGQSIIFYNEGVTDTVGVAEWFGQRAILYDDQRGTAGTNSYRENFLLGHLPMLLHPGKPKYVLHICFGVGNSLSAVASHDDLVRVDNVELSPHVLDAAKFFWTNNGVLQNPKVRTIIDDGRNFTMASRDQYDVIMLEPPELFTAGVINLYTKEFYQDALARLAPDGLMMQWMNFVAAPLEDEKMFFRAFSDVFPSVTAWRLMEGGPLMLIGSRQPMTIDYQNLKKRMQEPKVHRDLQLSGYDDIDHFLALFVFDDAGFRAFDAGVRPVTDDHTQLDFSMPRLLGSGFGLGSFNSKVQANGQGTFGPLMERSQYYFSQRRPIAPLLTNLGGDTPAAVQARVDAQAVLYAPQAKLYSEKEWRRWD